MNVMFFISFFTLCNALNVLDIFMNILGGGNSNEESQQANFCGITPSSCPRSPYRTINGSCNNLQNPSWGTPNTSYARVLPNGYSDGISSLPTSKSGQPLPSARKISLFIFKNDPVEDPKWTLNTMQWGQLLAHDMSLAASGSRPSPGCCVNGQNTGTDPRCANIPVPSCDAFYVGLQCLNFQRSLTTKDNNCTSSNAPAVPLSTVTAYMDASFVYGSTDSVAKSLRTMVGGKLKSVMRNGQEWPPQVQNPTQSCNVLINTEPCYMAGDTRVNQNTELTLLQVMFLRKHNLIATNLSSINNNWSDEKIYQETRRIIIACLQHVNYYELLPIYLGRNNMLQQKLIYDNPQGYINDYDASIDPAISVEHATAAFRFAHSAIAGYLKMYSEPRLYVGKIRLSTWMIKPSVLEEGSNFFNLARGINTQPEMLMDRFFDRETTNYLFRRNNIRGSDLRATDIQRARDHGVPKYNDVRVYCGLPKATNFSDFYEQIPKELADELSKVYESPDDVEYAVAGALESLVPGTLFGPTYLCILLDQFQRTRIGDRYFYELGNQDGAFTPEQLASIRNGATIAGLFCEVAGIQSIQRRALELISDSNPVVPCNQLPTVNLNLWKEN